MGRKASGHDYLASLHPFLCLSVNVSCSLCSFQLIFLTCCALCRPIIPVCCHMFPVYWILSRADRKRNDYIAQRDCVFEIPWVATVYLDSWVEIISGCRYHFLINITLLSLQNIFQKQLQALLVFPAFLSPLGFRKLEFSATSTFFYARSG